MKKISAAIALGIALASHASSVDAQEFIIGAGYADYTDDPASDGGIITLEYIHSPFWTSNRLSASFAGAFSLDEHSGTHVGIGVAGRYKLDEHWFLEASVLPGVYNADVSVNDLGGDFQIRSLLGIGYRFDNGNRLSVAITHKSNASTDEFNPGVNAALVRYHTSF